MSNTVDNPFFARLWTVLSGHEPESVRRLRRENLAGLSGRVLEVGAGTGTNFEFYPDTVTEVVAVEPERRLAGLAQRTAETAPVPVSTDTVEQYAQAGLAQPFDAVVCSLVLCSVDEPDGVLRQLLSLVRPGGELRCLEHVASSGRRARLQKLADATLWPWMLGNCHTHRHTEETIVGAGFQVTARAASGPCPPGYRCRCRNSRSVGGQVDLISASRRKVPQFRGVAGAFPSARAAS